jgi:Cdc6-like AAA superfamily ATPase
LKRLCECATDEDINPGYHTAQLQQRLANHLRDMTPIMVLDDLAFLLANDGNDLLYFLSRLERHTALSIVGIAAQPSLLPDLDERTYSSLRPQHLAIASYSEDEVAHILADRVEGALPPDTVTSAVLEHIAAITSNLTLGLHWLKCAAAQAAEITVSVLQTVQDDSVQHYRNALLNEFTWHHTVLLDVIDQATVEAATVTTGTVYDHYREYCRTTGNEPLTARRISDYLTQLELLNLIDVTHYHGGKRGKTREIRPTSFEEL